MASVDVPVALLGYGTVGSAVDRLLQAQAADIERATGHRLRVVRALVRDPRKERGGVAVTTDFAEIRDDPSIAVVAEVMGGLEPAGDHVLELLRAGQAGRDRQQAARRPPRRGAVRRGDRGRRAAPLRGLRLRGDPGDQGAARGARRLQRPPGPRDRERDDELRPHRDGARLDATRRRSPRRSGSASRRPTRPRTSPGIDAAAKMAILATVAFGSRVTHRRRRLRGARAGRRPPTSPRRGRWTWSSG